MSYGWCYSAAPTSCSGKAQPGTRILRDTLDELYPDVGDLGIYNCRPSSGGGGSLSRHANGTAWDAASSTLAINRLLGDFFVAAAQDLGVQRVICWGPRFDGTIGPREWDAREGERRWEYYTGPSAHQDHAHVELCWRASQELTAQQVRDAYHRYWPGQEDDLPYTEAQLRTFIKEEVVAALDQPLAEFGKVKTGWRYLVWKSLFKLKPGKPATTTNPADFDEHLNLLETKIDGLSQ